MFIWEREQSLHYFTTGKRTLAQTKSPKPPRVLASLLSLEITSWLPIFFFNLTEVSLRKRKKSVGTHFASKAGSEFSKWGFQSKNKALKGCAFPEQHSFLCCKMIMGLVGEENSEMVHWQNNAYLRKRWFSATVFSMETYQHHWVVWLKGRKITQSSFVPSLVSVQTSHKSNNTDIFVYWFSFCFPISPACQQPVPPPFTCTWNFFVLLLTKERFQKSGGFCCLFVLLAGKSPLWWALTMSIMRTFMKGKTACKDNSI